jgi:ABC-type sugar transport system ATPase subunit
MADIRFERVRKVYDGGVVALEEFSLHIPSPTLVVLVGPSGCGKTTLLRLIAGLEKPTSGTMTLGGERLDGVEPRRRDVAMVFQNYALYPHMTVRENLSFGLKIRKVPKETVVKSIEDVAKNLDIGHLLDRRPGELSGGQRQRVALGRAIVREPKVFLFDEPLSNLDARLRDDMRYMIKRLYHRLRTTMVYVTHDQVEAMTIGELLVVLKDGRVHQVGSPLQCYARPEDTFVASFLGSPPMNLLEGTYLPADHAVALANGSRLTLTARWSERLREANVGGVTVGVRPEDLTAGQIEETPHPMSLEGKVMATETLGHDMLAHVDLGGREVIVRASADRMREWGERIALHLREGSVHFFSTKDGRRIEWPEDRAGGERRGASGGMSAGGPDESARSG